MAAQSVSVVIPAYNSARTIARPLASLLNQTHPPDEILVIDDGSTDDLASAMQPFLPRATLLKKPNGGAASARNFGVDHAKCDLVAFLDADDYWEPTKLERQLTVFEEHPEVGLVSCRWREEQPDGSKSQTCGDPADCGRVIRCQGRQAWDLAMKIWTGTVLVRRDALKDERFIGGLEPAEDRDLWVRLLSRVPAFVVPEVLAAYVQYPNSLSNANADRDCGSMLRVVHRHAELLGKSGVRRQEAIVFCRWAARHLAAGSGRKAFSPAFRRLQLEPFSLQAWWIVFKSAMLAFR